MKKKKFVASHHLSPLAKLAYHVSNNNYYKQLFAPVVALTTMTNEQGIFVEEQVYNRPSRRIEIEKC